MSTQMPPTPSHLHHLHHHPRRAVDLRIPAIEKYAYCLCLHVKPTTIFIAVFKLIRALLFASVLLNTEYALSEQVQDSLRPYDDRHKSTAAAMTILTRIMMASVSATGIYAVVSGRAALLMPLYAMLLVDFFFALPAFYSRDMDSTFDEGLSYQHQSQHQVVHPQYARYSIILFSTVAMMIKIYFLCVVWKCYRYLRLIELVTPIRLSEIYPHLPPTGMQYPVVRVLGSIDSTDLSSGHNATPPPYESVASGMKPPNYEEAIKSSGTVFTVHNPSLGNSIQTSEGLNNYNNNQQQPQQQSQSAQQTLVFTMPNSDQFQNVSTHVVGPHVGVRTVDSVRPQVSVSNDVNPQQPSQMQAPATRINMSSEASVASAIADEPAIATATDNSSANTKGKEVDSKAASDRRD